MSAALPELLEDEVLEYEEHDEQGNKRTYRGWVLEGYPTRRRLVAPWFGQQLYERGPDGEYVSDEHGAPVPSAMLENYCINECGALDNGLPLSEVVLDFREGIFRFVLRRMLRDLHPELGTIAFFKDEWVEEGNGDRCSHPDCTPFAKAKKLEALSSSALSGDALKAALREATRKCTHEITRKRMVRVKAKDQHAVLSALVETADYSTHVVGKHIGLDLGIPVTIDHLAAHAGAMSKRRVERALKVLRGDYMATVQGRRLVQILPQYHPRFGRAASVYIILLAPILRAVLPAIRDYAHRELHHRGARSRPSSTMHGRPSSTTTSRSHETATPAARPSARSSSTSSGTDPPPPPAEPPPRGDEELWRSFCEVVSEVRGYSVGDDVELKNRAAIVATTRELVRKAEDEGIEDAERWTVRAIDKAYRTIEGKEGFLLKKKHALKHLFGDLETVRAIVVQGALRERRERRMQGAQASATEVSASPSTIVEALSKANWSPPIVPVPRRK